MGRLDERSGHGQAAPLATLLGVIRGAAAASRVLRGGTGLAAGLLCCVDSVEVKEEQDARMPTVPGRPPQSWLAAELVRVDLLLLPFWVGLLWVTGPAVHSVAVGAG